MVSRVKTWVANETLTASDLNTEFNTIISAVGSGTADHIDLTDIYAWSGAHSWSAATTHTNTLTVGVDDAGHDVKFFGNAAGAFSLWDASADTHIIRGATAAGPGKLNLSTGELTVVDGDILGRIDFQAPLEASGTDAIAVGASIWAEADDTFASGLNDTDLVFAVAESEIAAERMRLSYDGTTVGLTFPGVTTISTAAGALNLTPAAGSVILLDGTISVDAGVVTGATAITLSGELDAGSLDISGDADIDGTLETDAFSIGGTTVSSTAAELNYNDTGAAVGTVVASKTVTVDSNKDAASFRNITLTGELDAGSLDVSGDADIDGTLEADAITIGSTAIGSIYGVVAGSSSIVTGGTIGTRTWQGTAIASSYVATLNQDTTGTAALATSVTASANNSTDETVYPTFVDGATGTQGIETDTGLTYNPSSGLLSSTAFAGTLNTAAQTNITSLGTLTSLAVNGDIDMAAYGNRIDLDTDNDTSIRCSADDTMVLELGGEDYFTMYNTGASNTTATWEVDTIDRGIVLELKVPSSANSGWMSFKFTEGAGDGTANDMGYTFSYGPSSDYFRFQSQDIDGSATTGDVYRILDGQLSIDANTTWDANVFDYVCGECGRHEAEKFSCCGPVAWHDDVALMDEVIHGVGKNKHVVEKLEKLGVVNTYGTLGTDKPELYTSLQKMPWFLMSGMVQMSNRIDELESRLEMN